MLTKLLKGKDPKGEYEHSEKGPSHKHSHRTSRDANSTWFHVLDNYVHKIFFKV